MGGVARTQWVLLLAGLGHEGLPAVGASEVLDLRSALLHPRAQAAQVELMATGQLLADLLFCVRVCMSVCVCVRACVSHAGTFCGAHAHRQPKKNGHSVASMHAGSPSKDDGLVAAACQAVSVDRHTRACTLTVRRGIMQSPNLTRHAHTARQRLTLANMHCLFSEFFTASS
eukprot:1159827-Pelagomonas_calceolata.AAC.9